MANVATLSESKLFKNYLTACSSLGLCIASGAGILAGLNVTPRALTAILGFSIGIGFMCFGWYLDNRVDKIEERHKLRESRMEKGIGETTPFLSFDKKTLPELTTSPAAPTAR